MKFLVTLECDEQGWIVAECPALPGCVSQGRSEEETLANIREAIELSLKTRRELNINGRLQVFEVEIQSV